MRLLMTTDTVGGVWTYTAELTAALLERGVSIALVTIGPKPSAAQHEWLHAMESLWGSRFRWQVCLAPLEWMSSNEGAYRDAEPALLQIVREFQPDLLHSNQYCFGALPVAIPRLVAAHSDVVSWARACDQRALTPSAWLDQYLNLVKSGLRGAEVVVAPTAWMLHALGETFSLPARVEVVYNGRTLAEPGAYPERKLQAVSAGRLWDEAKNLKLLRSVHAPFPIVVAGETSAESNAASETNCIALGQLDEATLLSLFRQSAIYLCPSTYEPFGLAPLEAALCGCAVLANDIPSLREVWDAGALYFHDAASLSALLVQLAEQPHLLAAAQRRSFQRAQRYSAAKMRDRYLELYRSMLGSKVFGSQVSVSQVTGFVA